MSLRPVPLRAILFGAVLLRAFLLRAVLANWGKRYDGARVILAYPRY